ncbi:N-acetylmuramoyl-L-alanine amidase [Aureibacter tunicatorum]|uniref:N-acetylmuramoyl-L-alanine amidase n=1 Tax=Aureibacter tunicatorum TaxID=866807 RepID=A0AAE3XS12_9BACT|nr:N-acetylmuramoyl-L-alanine amidase [Aureibacter tunicatorum]MDR6240974.1 N-acetylmuramoyl-L-alanine amidase [Aureibacter tunicatorum]BDD03753.1 N-acetylmuramoyl-L-alanine amidase [Aureibacter tunicatorum]
MKKLKYLVLHCTDTPVGRVVSKEDIDHWHMSPVAKGGRGWSRPGYSDMIGLCGELVNLRPYDQDEFVQKEERTWGARGYNAISRHVVYAGGKGGDTRTDEQLATMFFYCHYFVRRHPDAKIIGHNQISSKSCPGFDVPAWLRSIGIDEKHIVEGKLV